VGCICKPGRVRVIHYHYIWMWKTSMAVSIKYRKRALCPIYSVQYRPYRGYCIGPKDRKNKRQRRVGQIFSKLKMMFHVGRSCVVGCCCVPTYAVRCGSTAQHMQCVTLNYPNYLFVLCLPLVVRGCLRRLHFRGWWLMLRRCGHCRLRDQYGVFWPKA
jgi:hypothetical protein